MIGANGNTVGCSFFFHAGASSKRFDHGQWSCLQELLMEQLV